MFNSWLWKSCSAHIQGPQTRCGTSGSLQEGSVRIFLMLSSKLGCVKYFKLGIELKSDSKPIFCKPCVVPLAFKMIWCRLMMQVSPRVHRNWHSSTAMELQGGSRGVQLVRTIPPSSPSLFNLTRERVDMARGKQSTVGELVTRLVERTELKTCEEREKRTCS